MKSWISIVGSSPFAVINTLWAACRIEGYVPEEVVFVVNQNLRKEDVEKVYLWAGAILKEYEVEKPVFVEKEVEENDFGHIEEVFRASICRLKKKGSVAVDITPGRKFMSAIAMHCGFVEGADHVFYLHLKDSDFQDEPFPLIPVQKQQLFDLIREGICCDCLKGSEVSE